MLALALALAVKAVRAHRTQFVASRFGIAWRTLTKAIDM